MGGRKGEPGCSVADIPISSSFSALAASWDLRGAHSHADDRVLPPGIWVAWDWGALWVSKCSKAALWILTGREHCFKGCTDGGARRGGSGLCQSLGGRTSPPAPHRHLTLLSISPALKAVHLSPHLPDASQPFGAQET